MHKKGVDLSVNVIIVAAIALAVLVVLFMIFTGRLGMFSKGVGETASCENTCKALGKLWAVDNTKSGCESRAGGGTYISGKYDDAPAGVCCCYGSIK